MIRTRDFLVFSGVMVFLFAMITVTAVTDSLNGIGGQVANVGSFAKSAHIEGAVSPRENADHQSNIVRLKTKIAAGEGTVPAGSPVFTSVDDMQVEDATAVTDQILSESVQIGQSVDGQPLMSDDLWRFVGYSQFEQIGVALNGTPIFGSRADNAPLDQCSGIDDGGGYKLYLSAGSYPDPACFGG